jgi:limonene-1,2-epoxide hydrolase
MTSNTNPESVVRAFFDSWEADGFVTAFQRYLDPEALWQNSGFPDCQGREACMGLLRYYQEFSQMPFARVELKNIATVGNVVLTERVDHLYNADRSRQHSAPIMGTFEVRNGLITRYSDYFDAAQFKDMIVRTEAAA